MWITSCNWFTNPRNCDRLQSNFSSKHIFGSLGELYCIEACWNYCNVILRWYTRVDNSSFCCAFSMLVTNVQVVVDSLDLTPQTYSWGTPTQRWLKHTLACSLIHPSIEWKFKLITRVIIHRIICKKDILCYEHWPRGEMIRSTRCPVLGILQIKMSGWCLCPTTYMAFYLLMEYGHATYWNT